MSHGTEEHLEHAQHAQHAEHAPPDPFFRRVAMTMAIVAAVLALVTMLSHREHNETLRYETLASDQWNYYQAKKNRAYLYDAMAGELPILGQGSGNAKTAAAAKQLAEKWKTDRVDRYEKEADKIQEEAKKLHEESEHAHHRADRYDLGELGVELALVLCSIAVLTKTGLYWHAGIVVGLLGLGIAVSGYFLH